VSPAEPGAEPGANPVAVRLARLEAEIRRAAERAGRDAASVTLVAVVKGVGAGEVALAHAAGLRHFGQNRVAEAEAAVLALGELSPAPVWHLIGHLQRNKARRALGFAHTVDSVDSLRLARELDRLAGAASRRLPVLLEVNVSAEPSKHGVSPAALPELLDEVVALPALEVQGLMTVGPLTDDPERQVGAFHALARLREDLSGRIGRALPRLSMGMSGDYRAAIAAGATEIRLGRVLFGER
jgi:pyridoxal phosphate enzyme (YggS family)